MFRVIYGSNKNTGGSDMERKEIVKRLSEQLGIKSKYLGAPNFDYEIRTEEETYTVDRRGMITTSEGRTTTLDEILNPSEPTPEEHEEIEVINPNQEETLQLDGLELKLPLGNHTGRTLKNIINMLSSKQDLIMMSFETAEVFMDGNFAKALNDKEFSTLEELSKALNGLGAGRCPGITFDFEEGTFTIKLTAENLTHNKISAFQNLIVLMNESAKKLKRASFKPSQNDNPKYAMRTWLIRLGMNGEEYKAVRKTLLSKLEGNSSFRKVPKDRNGGANT